MVLIGPNTYFPLTAFSKKQTSVSISSTEAEVVAANISLRAVGLPSSGLWAYLQNAGGDGSTPGGLPLQDVRTKPENDGEYWEFIRSRRLLVRVHPNKRTHLFFPEESKTIPVPIRRIGFARTTIYVSSGVMDFIQDNWKKRGSRVCGGSWTGRTFFRVYGPYDNDYTVEGSEVREALTDLEFVGQEKMGDYNVSLFPPPSIRGVFIEDNQATIRILENGKSPTFRHTDKTQRINLSWLSEQYKRGWYDLTYGPSKMQVADILTKPFTNAEKWKFALSLMSHVLVKGRPSKPQSASTDKPQPQVVASSGSSGEPRAGLSPNRLIVEICCNPNSKLSDTSREVAVGCKVVQFTERHNLLDEKYRDYVLEIVNSFPGGKPVLLWLSLPCTGGTSWSFVNMKIPSAAKKVMRHVKLFKKLWRSTEKFVSMITREFHVAIEWPQNCRYWKFPRVVRFMKEHSLLSYSFHGCMLGTVDLDGTPIKKPWTVATSLHEIGMELSKYQCDDSHIHVQGRGKSLKETEAYTFEFTDCVHTAYHRAATSARTCVVAIIQRSPVEGMSSQSTVAAAGAVVDDVTSPPEGRPLSEPFWKQDADFQVEAFPPEHRLPVYQRVIEWEKRLADMKASAVACTFTDGYAGTNQIGSSQIPIGDVVESIIAHDLKNTHSSYTDLVKTVSDIPAALFGCCICPQECEVDCIIIGDSSFALVNNHDEPGSCARLSFGDLLQSKDYVLPQVRSIYAGLKWGKGLSAIVHHIWELMEKAERQNRLDGRETLPFLVVVGWGGNDVHGEYGYQGCTWIHRKSMNRSDADRKVAAEYVEKQLAKVKRSLDGLVEIHRDPRVLSVQVVGNGGHDEYNLPPSYNKEMGKHVNWLSENGIQTICPSLLYQGSKYDDFHLIDSPSNRKLVYRFMRGVITFHLKYVEIMTKRDALRYYAEKYIKDENDRREAVHLFPNMIQFRLALARTQEVMIALRPEEKTLTPAQEFDKADEEILMWVHSGIEEAEQEATREGRPQPIDFTTEEFSSIVPVDPTAEDEDTAEQRARLYLQRDLDEAKADGFSVATDESFEVAGSQADDDDVVEVVPDVDDWELVKDGEIVTPMMSRSRKT